MTMIIDLDSHLRDGYFLDEIYKLEGTYAKLTPVPVGNAQGHKKKFIHSLDPISPQGRAAHSHPYIYDPDSGWRGGGGAGGEGAAGKSRRGRSRATTCRRAAKALKKRASRSRSSSRRRSASQRRTSDRSAHSSPAATTTGSRSS